MMRIPLRNFGRKRRTGFAMIEIALVLPLLMLFTIGLVQYGLVVHAASIVKNLTRDGARYASINGVRDYNRFPDSYQTTKDHIIETARPLSVTPGDLQVEVRAFDANGNATLPPDSSGVRQPVPPQSGNTIEVAITYDMKKKLFLPSRFFGYQIFSDNYVSDAIMVIE